MGLSETAKKMLRTQANSWARKELGMPAKGNLNAEDKVEMEEKAFPKYKELLAKAMAEKAEPKANSDEETPSKQVVESGVPAVDVPPAPAAVPPKQPVHRRLPQPPAKKTKLSPDLQVPTIRDKVELLKLVALDKDKTGYVSSEALKLYHMMENKSN